MHSNLWFLLVLFLTLAGLAYILGGVVNRNAKREIEEAMKKPVVKKCNCFGCVISEGKFKGYHPCYRANLSPYFKNDNRGK